MGLLYKKGEGPATDTRSVAFPPAPEDRNLLRPYIPGTKEWTKNLNKQIEDMPYPSIGMKSENLMGLAGLAPAAFTAYHGTPHNFNKFDTSKVGEGQGSQSYGHGLYFAENPKVAGEYQQMLSKGLYPSTDALEAYFKPGRVVNSYGGKDVVVGFKRTGTGENSDWAVGVKSVDSRNNDIGNPIRWHRTTPSQKDLTEVLKSEGREDLLKSIQGNMYKVDIHPPPDKFLDWDKPLSEQPENLAKAKRVLDNHLGGEWEKFFPDASNKISNWTAKDLYTQISELKGMTPEKASKALADAGIPGIRYLDQGSRSAGKGTYNYVVFNDKDVKILERK